MERIFLDPVADEGTTADRLANAVPAEDFEGTHGIQSGLGGSEGPHAAVDTWNQLLLSIQTVTIELTVDEAASESAETGSKLTGVWWTDIVEDFATWGQVSG